MLNNAFSRFSPLAICLAASLMANPAFSHGQHDEKEHRAPRLSLQAQASSEVQQDTVTITLASELEGQDQADVARRLTEQLNKTLAAARGEKGVEARNGAYRLWPNTDRDGKITAWRGRAEVLLESTDLPAAAALAARLSDHMPISDIGFSLSPEARATEEQRLLQEAANAFSQRAEAAARAFGFSSYDIRNIDLGGSGAVFAKSSGMARAAFSGDSAPPDLQAGTTIVTVSVQGEVALRTSDKP
jgi:predicted secreted protein